MVYSVKEMYLTLQGEGAQTGRAAVFLRFSGCNLWSGLERERASAVCTFCDTDFVGTDGPGGGKFKEAQDLARTVTSLWPEGQAERWVVCTGGEPMLQLDKDLIDALHAVGFKIAVETNGTLEVPRAIDWICVSPKADAALLQSSGDELKLVFPQSGNHPDQFGDLAFTHFFLQPCDPSFGDTADIKKQAQANAQACIEYCLANPKWRLSTQTHKVLGID